ncbi:hypothetical protein [Ruegeria sp. SCP11]|uniref:hypothetical protein n=1 Tax=Ruegeria sp. SCP11 TaxID=3141378 RepID=UPI0033375B24
MRKTITDAIGDVLHQSPQLAPAVARQFGARRVWSQRDSLSGLVRAGLLVSPLDVLAVSQYIAMADDLPGSLNSIDSEKADTGVSR